MHSKASTNSPGSASHIDQRNSAAYMSQEWSPQNIGSTRASTLANY